jgi:hypothetical protein
VAVLVSDLTSEVARRAAEAVAALAADPAWDCALVAPGGRPPARAPVLDPADLWGYRGVVVSTDLDTLALAARLPAPGGRVHYAWDWRWAGDALATRGRLAAARAVCRTPEHADRFAAAWGLPVWATAYYPDPRTFHPAATAADPLWT